MKSIQHILTTVVILGFIQTLSLNANEKVIHKNDSFYFGNVVIIKLKEMSSSGAEGNIELSSSLQQTLNFIGIENAMQRFNPQEKITKEAIELQKIVTIEYNSPLDPVYVCAKISKHPEIEWAEPRYLDKIDFTPNDPSLSSQYALDKIQAATAWDINQGDPSIIIAINDTGVDWDHPDLAANIWQNDDPIDGTDNDGNGYIDDIRGWDFGGLTGTPDNDPAEDRPDHGTHVAGIASAVTNNGVGIASIGFNCTIMPVKTSQDNIRFGSLALISHGYDGMIYAADNGADVINCSWGGFSYSIANQEVIDYVVSQGVLVVGAAGNDNTPDVIYPAAYYGALSVGSTTSTDLRSSFSNYGIKLEVAAPGSGILSTWQDDTYISISGTSMASPLVAGLAGLVTNQFPGYTPLQVAEQIRVTADNVDAANPSLINLFGAGRINAHRALTESSAKSVRIESYLLNDEGDGDGVLEPGEAVSISMDFKNYLNPTTNLSITIGTTNGNITFSSSSFSAGAVGTLQSFNNSSNEFRFTISPSAPLNADVNFLIEFSDGTYSDFQWVTARINPTYSTQSGNNIALTITSKGALGFDDYPNNALGEGLKFNGGTNAMFEGAFLCGTSATQVMDAARIGDLQSTDFTTLLPFTLSTPGAVADQQGLTRFNDDGAGSAKLGIETELQTYSYADQQFENFIILKYTLTNNSNGDISGLRAGLFFDMDLLASGTEDVTGYDNTDNFAYAYHQGGNPHTYFGAAALTSVGGNYYGVLNPGGSGSFSIYDQFTDDEKWTALSSGVQNIGLPAGDISFLVSAEAIDIPAGQQRTVAFAIAAGDSLEALRTAIQTSRANYILLTDFEDENLVIPTQFSLEQNYPNPFNPATNIKFTVPSNVISTMFAGQAGEGRNLKDFSSSSTPRNDNAHVQLKIYDILGNEIAVLVNETKAPGVYEVEFKANRFSTGVYFYRLTAGSFVQTRKMMLLK